MRNIKKVILLALVLLTSLAVNATILSAKYEVVPLPNSIEYVKNIAPFVLSADTKIVYPSGNAKMKRNAEFLSEYIEKATGKRLSITTESKNDNVIELLLGIGFNNNEAYTVNVATKKVMIEGASEAGVFYGIQTLRKSLPIDKEKQIMLPAARISDFPRFPYRGMMLDVSRHFFTVDEVKEYIDILALHNVNNFHWHLSEDQGWRIEIKKYPKLTQIGQYRDQTVIGHNSGKYDGVPYQGFYTQEQAKEVVAYASERNINVVPEIDMPGHMLAALASYPELGCTGGPYKVWQIWGVADDVLCAGNDKTLQFISDVLNEIMDIFPSQYIHAGGDECPKVRWEKCPKCQARIKAEGIKSDDKHTAEQYLQGFITSYAEKVIEARGRVMIGWDEILEGKIGNGATVMSWRGNAGGIEAARRHHDVIMVPNTHLYFDFYQSKEVDQEPDAIGGFIPVEKVYGYNPIPDELNAGEAKYIKGLQANIWTEYIPTFSQVQYMLLPRLAALSEVQWTQQTKKDYGNFRNRMAHMMNVYDLNGYNYAKHMFDISATYKPDTKNKSLNVSFVTMPGGDIYYTLDGSKPTLKSKKYTSNINIKKDAVLSAVVIRKSGESRILCDTIAVNKATFHNIKLLQNPQPKYAFSGASLLNDGISGNENYRTGRWIGFCGNNMEAVVDLDKPTVISSVSLNTCVFQCDGVVDARGMQILVSDDNINYRLVSKEDYPEADRAKTFGTITHILKFAPVKARFIKVIAQSERVLPSWHPFAGSPGFLFVDEITIK